MRTMQNLYQMQGLPLNLKIRMTKERIRQWINEFGEDGVYVSFSGGKDSTVLLHLVREEYPNVKAVFVDTGLEYPEIRQFVKTFDNVEWLKPKMNFKQVIQKYGYPFISKEVSERVYYAQKFLTWWREQNSLDRPTDRPTAYSLLRFVGVKGKNYQKIKENIPDDVILDFINNSDKGTYKLKELYDIDQKGRYDFSRWKFLASCPAMISSKCCDVMKKGPAHKYQKETGRNPMTAQMATESRLRTQKWLQNGCNGFDLKSPISNPMAFWTEQDVLLYIYTKHLPICSVYGDIVKDNSDGVEGQMDLEDVYGKELFDLGRPTLKTTGCNRTGCMFCGFGCHLEKPGEGRFERMKETHPRLYEYVFADGITVYTVKDKNGYEIKVRERYLNKLSRWVEQNRNNTNFIITEKYIPDVGLGYKYIIDWINEHGNLNIRY